MDTLPLFDLQESAPEPITNWSSYSVTVGYTDAEIIKSIIALHNKGLPFDCDPTYSKGVFWEGLPRPKYKFDLMPQIAEVQQADARALPLDSSSLNSLMFDPPFVLKDVTDRTPTGKIESRFSAYKTFAELLCFYREAVIEFGRVLRPGGILAFKCQDTISGGKQHWSHVEVYNMARAYGFIGKDLYILVRNNVLWSPNMKNQQHARKTHCFYWVFKKDGKA